MEKPKRFHFSSFQIGVLTGVIIAFILAAVAVKNSGLFTPKANPMLMEGYNFRKVHNSDKAWRGPNLGERINLSQLKNSDGKSLAESIAGAQHIMLVTVDPECGICNLSGDLINSVREALQPHKIQYYPISFARLENSNNIDQYAVSLGFQSKAFTWAKDAESPPESLQNIVTPSHLLLDNTGKVLQVWAGSSAEKDIRDRMSQQIIADINIINDTLTVLERK